MSLRNHREAQTRDLFVSPAFDDLVAQDGHLTNELNILIAKGLEPKERIKSLGPDISRLIKKAGELSFFINSEQSELYDRVVDIAAKWSSFAAYCGGQVSLNNIAQDNREMGLVSLRDAYKAKIKGLVISTAMDKTVTVRVERQMREPRTGKTIRRSKNYLVHDEYGQCKVGDRVVAFETRPVSRRKRHSYIAHI